MSSIFDEFLEKLSNSEKLRSEITGSNLSISQAAEQEIDIWDGYTENDSEVYSRLQDYWDNLGVTGWSPNTAWSGAFISYILRDQGFQGSGLHSRYVGDIIDGQYPSWSAYPTNADLPIQVNVGDVLARRRSSGYDSGHADIVYRIDGDTAYLVGGNLSNTVRTMTLSLDNGQLSTNTYEIILKRYSKKKSSYLSWVAVGVALWIFLS